MTDEFEGFVFGDCWTERFAAGRRGRGRGWWGWWTAEDGGVGWWRWWRRRTAAFEHCGCWRRWRRWWHCSFAE
jgi:hypothetical protein